MTIDTAASKKVQEPSALDYYAIEEKLLTEDEKLARDSARQFVEREILPHIKRWDSGNTSPYPDGEALVRDVAKKLAASVSLYGATLPGLGDIVGDSFIAMTPTAYGLCMRELEAGDTALRSVASVQSGLGMYAIHSYGSPEQKKRWLPALYRGEKLVCFALTEPSGGSEPNEMHTTASKSGGGWILNGDKVWITNGFADVAVVWARTSEGIRGFLVEKGTPGFSVRHEEKWALRAGIASSLSFVNCRIPAGNLLPKTVSPAGKDNANFLRCLSEARYGIVWGAVGAARACLLETIEFCRGRRLFGQPLAAKQKTQDKLVWMLNEIENASLVAFQLGRLKGEGRLSHAHVSLAKYNNVAKAVEVAQLAVDTLPADVFTFEAYHSGRHLRNLQVVKKYEGAHEVHMLVVGRAITGHAAF